MPNTGYDTLLGSLADVVRDNELLDQPIELMQRFGSPTMSFIQRQERNLQQGSNPIRFYLGGHDSVRTKVNAQANFHAPSKARSAQLDVKFVPNTDDPDDTDVRTFNGVARITQADMDEVLNGRDHEVDFAERFLSQANADINNRATFLFHSDKSGAIGEIDTGGVLDEALSFDEASSYTNGSTSATIKIKGMSKGRFPRDMLIDIYDGDVLSADALRIVRVAHGDTIVVEATEDTTVSNLDLVDAGDKVYRTGDKDSGAPGALNEVIKESYSSGESWFRLDRTQAANMHYVPEVRLRAGLSDEMVNLSHLTDLSNEVEGKYDAFSLEDSPDYKAVMGLALKQTLLREADGQSIRVVEGDTNDGSFRSGRARAVHQTSGVGEVELVGDKFARNDRMIMLPSDAIKMAETASGGMTVYTNQVGGMFDRVESGSSDGGGTKEWKYEADTKLAFIPNRVIDTAAVFNLTA